MHSSTRLFPCFSLQARTLSLELSVGYEAAGILHVSACLTRNRDPFSDISCVLLFPPEPALKERIFKHADQQSFEWIEDPKILEMTIESLLDLERCS